MKKAIIQTDFTPPEIGKMLKITPTKVLGFINSGELKAYNVGVGKAPRYRIHIDELHRFRERRAVVSGQCN